MASARPERPGPPSLVGVVGVASAATTPAQHNDDAWCEMLVLGLSRITRQRPHHSTSSSPPSTALLFSNSASPKSLFQQGCNPPLGFSFCLPGLPPPSLFSCSVPSQPIAGGGLPNSSLSNPTTSSSRVVTGLGYASSREDLTPPSPLSGKSVVALPLAPPPSSSPVPGNLQHAYDVTQT